MNANKELKIAAKYVRDWATFAFYHLVVNRPVEWVAEGEPPEVEYWSRKSKVRILRPRYNGLLHKLPCGCSKRLGKIVYYLYGCSEHCNLSKRLDSLEGES